MSLAVCIVGCGSYARTVMDDIYDMGEGLEFFFASRDVDKARDYCEVYDGIDFFGSYEDAVSDSRVQALYFFTPHDVHLDNVQMAARNGKHVLLEKPIARTLTEAGELVGVAHNAGIKLMIAENFRFLPAVNKAREMLSSGIIGKLRLIEVRREGYDPVSGGWRSSKSRNGGGRLIDGGVHYIDVVLNIAGFPERLYAVVEEPKVIPDHEGEDGVYLVARLSNGVTGVVHYSGGTQVNVPFELIRLTGTKGVISFAPMGSNLTLDTRESNQDILVEPSRRGVRHMMREFQSCIIENREPAMSGSEATKHVAVVLAAYESASLGKEVHVPQL